MGTLKGEVQATLFIVLAGLGILTQVYAFFYILGILASIVAIHRLNRLMQNDREEMVAEHVVQIEEHGEKETKYMWFSIVGDVVCFFTLVFVFPTAAGLSLIGPFIDWQLYLEAKNKHELNS